MTNTVSVKWAVFALLLTLACLNTADARGKKVNTGYERHSPAAAAANRGYRSAWRRADRRLARRIAALEAAIAGDTGPTGEAFDELANRVMAIEETIDGDTSPSADDFDELVGRVLLLEDAIDDAASVPALAARIDALETLVAQQHAAMQAMLACIRSDSDSFDLVFEGCNVHVRNGNGSSDSDNGLGNLIVGYNEDGGNPSRVGSHNLVIGPDHEYAGNNGLIAGNDDAFIALDATRRRLDLRADEAGFTTEDDLTIESDTGNLVLDADSGNIGITASSQIDLAVGASNVRLGITRLDIAATAISADAGTTLDLEGVTTSIEGTVSMNVDGAIINLNGGGSPVASVGDLVLTPAGPGSISTGSATIFVGN